MKPLTPAPNCLYGEIIEATECLKASFSSGEGGFGFLGGAVSYPGSQDTFNMLVSLFPSSQIPPGSPRTTQVDK